jgi:hypothetical protein
MSTVQYHLDDRKAVLEIDKEKIKKYWPERHRKVPREIVRMCLESAKEHRDMIMQLESLVTVSDDFSPIDLFCMSAWGR